ncbi:hypothetical protein [Membranihabitans maritimus]|uniref:hypothetical protein n=1 Tax=Membranihabitans maritimus TaxID=2904244 RepID=UPI001F2FB8C7|nr:hypothetical protein [Membranihabitans maritimus]
MKRNVLISIFSIIVISLLVSACEKENHRQQTLEVDYKELSNKLTPKAVGEIHSNLSVNVYNKLNEWNLQVPKNGPEIVYDELLIKKQSIQAKFSPEKTRIMYLELFDLNKETLSGWSIHNIEFKRKIDSLFYEDIMHIVDLWLDFDEFESTLSSIITQYSDHYLNENLLSIKAVSISSYEFWKENYPKLAQENIRALPPEEEEKETHPWARSVIGGDIKGAIGGSIFGGLAGALIGANAGTLLSIVECIGFGCE